MAKSTVGTAAAYKVCGGCGHARIRHFSEKVPGCSHTITQYPLPGMPDQRATTTRCTCPGFTPKKGGQ